MSAPPSGPLTGLRVLELGSGLAGAMTGMLLARAGADVVKVEPDGGDWTRDLPPSFSNGPQRVSPTFLYLNAGKRAVRSAALAAHGAERVDVLIRDTSDAGDWPAGGAAVELRYTLCGPGGPHSHWTGGDLVASAYGGWMAVCGDPGREPLKMGVTGAEYLAAAYGYSAVVASLFAGAGEHPRTIDVGVADVVAGNLEYCCLIYAFAGIVRKRWYSRQPHFYPIDLFPCSDGQAVLILTAPAERNAAALLVDRPDLLDHPLLQDDRLRIAHPEAFDAIVLPWLAEHTRLEVVEKAQLLRMPAAISNTMTDFLADPQLAAREYFQEVDHPVVGRLSHPGMPWRVDGRLAACGLEPAPAAPAEAFAWRPAPPRPVVRPHAATRPEKPLAGIRVVDLSFVYAGPTCTRILAELGAEVIKVESPTRIDMTRVLVQPENRTTAEYWNHAGYFIARNLGKQNITLDLTTAAGREALLALIDHADIVVEAYTPRVMQHWGLTCDALRSRNPGLIMLSMSGYGLGGPRSDWAAFGMGLEAAGGIDSVTGYGPDEVRRSGLSLTDFVAGSFAASAVLTALYERQRSGTGCHIDLSQGETAVLLAGDRLLEAAITGVAPVPAGNARPGYLVHGVYRCLGDDEWLAVETRTAADVGRLEAVIGGPLETLGDWCARRTPLEAARMLQDGVVAAAPISTGRDVLLDPQFRTRLFDVFDHDGVGPRPIPRQFPVRIAGVDVRPSAPAPRLGQHTRAVLRSVAGMDDAAIDALDAAGITGTEPRVQIPPRLWDTMGFSTEALVRHGAFILDPAYREKLGLA